MIDAHSSSNWSYLILQVLLEAFVALRLRFQSDPQSPPLSIVTRMNHSRATTQTHTLKKISIWCFAVAAECITIPVSIYSAWVMLGFGGCWVLWDTIQLLGREGGVSRQGYSLNRMIMSGTDYGGARGEKSPTNAHIDQQHTYFAVDSSSYFVFKSKSSAWVVSSAIKDKRRSYSLVFSLFRISMKN